MRRGARRSHHLWRDRGAHTLEARSAKLCAAAHYSDALLPLRYQAKAARFPPAPATIPMRHIHRKCSR